jgi:hypothetical protein
LAEIAGQARAVEPFDTSIIANFNVLDQFTPCNDYSSAFMSTNEG